jgi:hypothetical protein
MLSFAGTAQPFDSESVRKSVVRLVTDEGNQTGTGTVIIEEEGKIYILTAYHLIKKDIENDQSQVKVEFFDDAASKAEISNRRIDINNDVAILIVKKMPTPKPPEIAWGLSSAVRDTQKVFAVGHPIGVPAWSVTDGTVSSVEGGKIYFSGTAVSPGNSGGPLLNANGALIGMNLEVQGSQGAALKSDVILPLISGWLPRAPVPGEGEEAESASTDEQERARRQRALDRLNSYMDQRDGIKDKKFESESKMKFLMSEIEDLERRDEELKRAQGITQTNVNDTLKEIREIKEHARTHRDEPYREDLDNQLKSLDLYQSILNDLRRERRPIYERLKELRREYEYHKELVNGYEKRLADVEEKILAEKKIVDEFKD